MKDAFRGHYQPACDELIPGADPYIAGLVARAVWPGNSEHCDSKSRGRLSAGAALPLGPSYAAARVDRHYSALRPHVASRLAGESRGRHG